MNAPDREALQRFAADHGLVVIQVLEAGKAMLCSEDYGRLVKVGVTALGRHLARNELQGWALLAPLLRERFAVGRLQVIADDDQLVAFELDRLEGRPARSLFPVHPKISSCLAAAHSSVLLSELLAHERTSPSLTKSLLQAHGDIELPTTPSHGDYIYWNLLVGGSRHPGLIDFEYASTMRVAGWDDLHFRLAPWWTRALRRRLPLRPLFTLANLAAGNLKPATISRRLYADLFFVHWAAIRRQLAGACEENDPLRKNYLEAADKAEALLVRR